MLAQLGIDAEDREIASHMKLPYLFAKEDGVYLGGSMLQSAYWFNLYLNTLGLSFTETMLTKNEVPGYLQKKTNCMLGLRISPQDKHAIIFTGTENNVFLFINNKWKHTDEPEELRFTEQELLKRLDNQVMIAQIEKSTVTLPDFVPLLRQSCETLQSLKIEIQNFCNCQKNKEELVAARNTLFRPVLLDGITMLELIGQENLSRQFRVIQSAFLAAIRAKEPVILAEILPMDLFSESIDQYIALIENELLH